MQAILELSPAQAGIYAEEADHMRADAARFDEAVAEDAEASTTEYGLFKEWSR